MGTLQSLAQRIAIKVAAIENCKQSGNTAWQERHEDAIELMVLNAMPSGSGFDNGTRLDMEATTPERLVFVTSFHHMNDGGFYDGWTEHKVIVTPSLAHGFMLRITGRDRRDIKDYIADMFSECLRQVAEV